jgi:hypothetical protein
MHAEDKAKAALKLKLSFGAREALIMANHITIGTDNR